MRTRTVIILTLLVGVIGMVLLTRRSRPVAEAIEVSPPASTNARALFGRGAAPSFTPVAAPDETAPTATTTNLFQRLLAGEAAFELTPEQIAEYLRQYGTNVETLLATQRKEYVKLAAELFPNDPRVQYAVLTREIFPEAKREWLDRFKQSAPDNAMADYLSAREHLRAGDREQGLNDLAAAATKTRFNDYTLEQVQNMEDAQLSAGRSVVEAKVAAGSELLLPQLAMFKGLAQDVQKMQKEYLGAGDTASAEALAQLGHSLAQHLSTGEGSRTLIGQLVGISIERIVLNQFPPDSRSSFLNDTVQQRLDEIAAFRQDVRTLTPQIEAMMTRANETEIISYFDRMKLQGELKAMQWLKNRQSLR